MLLALREGFRAAGRSWGLAVALLIVNVATAALLAVPLAARLEADLGSTDSGQAMLYGFDYNWWSEWSDRQEGWTASFHPDIFGTGFAFKNVDLLLKGAFPAGLLAVRYTDPGSGEGGPALPDPVILALGVLYLVVQTFLAGGLLSVLRSPRGEWSVRSLLHGSGFYFGRMARLTALVLLVDFLLFRLNAPLAGWVEGRAREAVSESTAMAWLLGRHALLLLAVLLVHLLSGYAKAIVVLEERASAVLALASAVAFAGRHLLKVLGHYFTVVAAGVLLLAAWGLVDGAWETTGYKTQLLALALFQALVFGRMFLRLALMGGQLALYRRSSGTG
ncbi:MAG TPA: hypothetical protein VF310_10190 [Vicinamibacteria bacterium]